MSSEPDKPATWRPPTRRAFVAMIGAAAAALALREKPTVITERSRTLRSGRSGKPLWIGHC